MARTLKLSARERRITVLTFVIIGGALLYLNVLEPVVTDWLDAHKRAVEAEQQLAELQKLIQNKDKIEQEYKRLEGAVTSGASEQQLKIALLGEVDKLASECGLTVAGVKPTMVKKQKDFYRYGIELQANGENHKLVQFLYAMQNPEHLLHADQITVHAGRGSAPLAVTLRISKIAKLVPAS